MTRQVLRSVPTDLERWPDPYQWLGDLRQAGPVQKIALRGGVDGWIVTRYDEVRFVLGDGRFIKAPETVPEALRKFKAAFGITPAR